MMGKQHETFPREKPEIDQPSDPEELEVPKEDPQIVSEEYPAEK